MWRRSWAQSFIDGVSRLRILLVAMDKRTISRGSLYGACYLSQQTLRLGYLSNVDVTWYPKGLSSPLRIGTRCAAAEVTRNRRLFNSV